MFSTHGGAWTPRTAISWAIALSLGSACAGPSQPQTELSENDPGRGSLEITVVTTGQNLDPDGYLVTVDEGAGRSVGINESITFTALVARSVQVLLTEVADNCAVQGQNPRPVTISANSTASDAFVVTCT